MMAKQGCPLALPPKGSSIDQRDPAEVQRLTEILKGEFETVLGQAAYRGNPAENLKRALRELNRAQRDDYAQFKKEVGLNIKPLIVLNDYDPRNEGCGTTVTYFAKSGEIRHITPTSNSYGLYKDLSHIVTGVFTYVAPYFNAPGSIGWIKPLKEFQRKLKAVLHAIVSPDNGLEENQCDRARKMLDMTDQFITTGIAKKRVTLADFQKFGADMFPLCEENMKDSVKIQTRALIDKLSDLKQELGSDWEQTYFAVPTVWAVSGVNVRTQVLETLCTPQHLATHLIKMENVTTVDEARALLGSVVADRALGAATFGNAEGMNHCYALSTPQDLLSEFADLEIKKYVAGDEK